jgi:hypothetical protein
MVVGCPPPNKMGTSSINEGLIGLSVWEKVDKKDKIRGRAPDR